MFNDKRKDPDYTNADILSFKLVNKFAGYNSQILQSRASEDTLFTNFMKVPSQSTISRINNRLIEETIDTFADENIKLCKSSINKLELNNRKVMFRADSQFGNAGRIQAYDSLDLSYAIKMMRRDKQLEKIIETKTNECIKIQSNKNANDPIYGSLKYMSKSLGEVKIYFKSEIAPDDDQILLFDDYQIIVSNIEDTPENIFQFYNMRGASENIFRELKNDFDGNYMSHTNLIENKFEMLFSIFNYNVYKKMIAEIAPELSGITLCTFTRDYIKIAAKIVKHARIIHIKFDLGYRRIS